MKTLTVRLPEPLVATIEAESRARNISKLDVVRERLERAHRQRCRTASLDAIVDLIGSVKGLPPTYLRARGSICALRVVAGNVLVDASFLVALLSRRDTYHRIASARSTCEAVLSEAFHLIGEQGARNLGPLLSRRAVLIAFRFPEKVESVLRLIQKYSEVPMGFADACLVRMTETLVDSIVLTTDQDFRVYCRHSRQVVPCTTPEK